jgi:CDP-glycerol glycerophosphotransferase
LSVVIAAHRVADYLPACLDSVLAAPTPDLQVVGVDDASPDGCGAILDRAAAADARLTVLHLAPNRGLGAARNAGAAAATGRYVWFVDGDDRLAAGAVPAVLRRLADTEADLLLLGHARLVDDRVRPDAGGHLLPRCAGARVVDRPELLRVRQAAWNRVVRRDLAATAPFPDGWYEDVTFSHGVLLAAEHVATLPEAVYLYRQRPGAITATASARHFDVFERYERLFAMVPPSVRATLFPLMINHYLVVLGRVPPARRAMFFSHAAGHFRRYRPDGYRFPSGLVGVKVRLVAWNAYPLFRAFKSVFRALRGRRSNAAIQG